MLFRAARQAGIAVGDPTLDLTIAPQSRSRARPLTDDEVAECRGASTWSLGSTRRSATWALAEATCRSGEIPAITVGDVHLDMGVVNIRGGGRCAPRHGLLTPWGKEQIARRIETVGSEPSTPLVYVGEDPRLGGLVSANSTITQVLQRAGLADEPDVRPSSVVAWAGLQVLESTGRIEDVAKALGLKSLDRAAEFIGWEWQEPDGQASG
jgi:integrase/recombinase XerC